MEKFDFSDKGMTAFQMGSQEPAIIIKDLKIFPDAKQTIWFVVDDVKPEFEDPFGNRLGITDYSKKK